MTNKQNLKIVFTFILILVGMELEAQIDSQKMNVDEYLYKIASSPSAGNIEKDIVKLVNFGTRHTLSDTVSNSRGIGAARRSIKASFEQISKDCGNCLEVSFHRSLAKADNRRITKDTWIVNVLAVQKGTLYPNRYVLMSGDIDSRVSDENNFTSDAPGANDNASGMAGTIEAARVLSQYKFPVSIIFVGLSGEEQGLYGGKFLAETFKEKGYEIIGVLNNDMIGNIEGIDGVIENNSFRIFSEAISMNLTEQQRNAMRFYGGEVDGPSRQLARYIATLTQKYMTNLEPIMVYRLDRFGRGGHHRPFNDAGFPGVRIMETHENYNRQHQDIRVENGISYGDVIEGVNFDYASKLTGVNAITLASLASAAEQPKNVKIKGAVEASAKLSWDISSDKHLKGYKVYWRKTTDTSWQNSKYVGKVTSYEFKNLVIDNYLFGVASVAENGAESVVVFPGN